MRGFLYQKKDNGVRNALLLSWMLNCPIKAIHNASVYPAWRNVTRTAKPATRLTRTRPPATRTRPNLTTPAGTRPSPPLSSPHSRRRLGLPADRGRPIPTAARRLRPWRLGSPPAQHVGAEGAAARSLRLRDSQPDPPPHAARLGRLRRGGAWPAATLFSRGA